MICHFVPNCSRWNRHTFCRFFYLEFYFGSPVSNKGWSLPEMPPSIYPDYPPNLTSEQSDYLLSNIKDWSIVIGLAVRPSSSFVSESVDPSRSLAVTAPVTLFPSLFPKACFEEARAIQTAYNELYACIANDEEWLGEIVKEYAYISLCFIGTCCLRCSDHAQNICVLGKCS